VSHTHTHTHTSDKCCSQLRTESPSITPQAKLRSQLRKLNRQKIKTEYTEGENY